MSEPRSQYIEAGAFQAPNHFYPRVLNAHPHPLVKYFLGLGNERVIKRYCHLHPDVHEEAVVDLLASRPKYFRWGGADLFYVTNEAGVRQIVVVETNSCPSGQKSMPVADDADDRGGYKKLIERSFLPLLKRRTLPQGELAVIWDKNPMETTGYAAVMADLAGEGVHCVKFTYDDPDPAVRFTDDGVLEVESESGEWVPIRAALRYVTQRPWDRIPAITKTAILNPVLICLAGGRNKLLAAKAYDFYNAESYATGLRIRTPETIQNVGIPEIPLWFNRMGGVAVVKVPYSNAGQGVYTLTTKDELDAFMATEQHYDRFIVQSLVGNSSWTSRTSRGRLYHVGTVPDRKGNIYAADLRFMVGVSPEGFYPIAIYARRARTALQAELTGEIPSWDMLGTNLSVKLGENDWTTESERLLLMDSRDFNRLGIGVDDLTEAYIQTVMAVAAIDQMGQRLITAKGKFRRKFFTSLNPDPALLEEIRQ